LIFSLQSFLFFWISFNGELSGLISAILLIIDDFCWQFPIDHDVHMNNNEHDRNFAYHGDQHLNGSSKNPKRLDTYITFSEPLPKRISLEFGINYDGTEVDFNFKQKGSAKTRSNKKTNNYNTFESLSGSCLISNSNNWRHWT
jgi:hypothetical protein